MDYTDIIGGFEDEQSSNEPLQSAQNNSDLEIEDTTASQIEDTIFEDDIEADEALEAKVAVDAVEAAEINTEPEPEETPIEPEPVEDSLSEGLAVVDKDLAPAEEEPKRDNSRLMWMIFGLAVLTALIAPAGYLYYQNSKIPAQTPGEIIVVPVPGPDDESSQTTTSTAAPSKEEPSEGFGEEYENWDYRNEGRNIAKPLPGVRIEGPDGVNPKFYENYVDATDSRSHAKYGIDGSLKPKAGAPQPGDTEGSFVGGGQEGQSATIQLISIDPSLTKATIKVDGTILEAGVGDQLFETGWFVQTITSAGVDISNGTDSLTLKLGTLGK